MHYEHPVYRHAAVAAQKAQTTKSKDTVVPGLLARTGDGVFTRTACEAPWTSQLDWVSHGINISEPDSWQALTCTSPDN